MQIVVSNGCCSVTRFVFQQRRSMLQICCWFPFRRDQKVNWRNVNFVARLICAPNSRSQSASVQCRALKGERYFLVAVCVLSSTDENDFDLDSMVGSLISGQILWRKLMDAVAGIDLVITNSKVTSP
jgi:hypothetical protein